MSSEVAKIERMPAQVSTPADLLRIAVEGGADLDRLERLMTLQQQWEANEARKAYHLAMAAFKAEPLRISKDKHVRFQTQKGVTEYDHATLGNVVSQIVAGLARHGLSHSWEPKRMEGGRVQVACKITHQHGHSESISLDCGLDDSGGKNNIQALGSAITYLQRYTLLSITGLATEDQDDDGRGSSDQGESEEFARASQWIDKAAACDTADKLEKVKSDCIESYGMRDKVPPRVRTALVERSKALLA